MISYLEGYARAADLEGSPRWGMGRFNRWLQEKRSVQKRYAADSIKKRGAK